MIPLTLYRQQAAKEREAADVAVLTKVRDRCRRAAEAWTKLALQIEHTDELRTARRTAVFASNLGEPSENPDRGRATSSADKVGPKNPIIDGKEDISDG